MKTNPNISLDKELAYLIEIFKNPDLTNPREDPDKNLLFDHCTRHKLTPFVFPWFESQNFFNEPELKNRLTANEYAFKLRSSLHLDEIKHLSDLFKNNEIDFAFFKGPLLSQHVYGNYYAKQSKDIDVYVSKESIRDIHNMMIKHGYTPTYAALEIDKGKLPAILKIYSQLKYKNPGNSVEIEIHWKLSKLNWLDKKFSPLKKENQQPVKIDDREFRFYFGYNGLAYLFLHGSLHNWVRLFWLIDVKEVFERMDEKDQLDFITYSIELGLTIPVIEGLYLTHLLFKTSVPDSVHSLIEKDKNLQGFVSNCIRGLNISKKGIPDPSGSMFRKMMKLSRGFSAKSEVIKAYSTSYLDWNLLPLPLWLFWLYIPLRPFLWSYRKLFKKK